MRQAVDNGLVALILSSVIWGLSPVYFKALAHVPAAEVMAHRTLWSFVFFGAVLVWQRRAGLVAALLRGKDAIWVLFCALSVSSNWLLYIHSVQTGRTVEASLGYFIFPLIAVALGRVVFGERARPWQVLAMVMATLGVAVQVWGLGALPWVALVLGTNFGIYGMIKKRLTAGAVVSVTAEVAVLVPFALLFLAGLHWGWWSLGREAGWFGRDTGTTLLLVLSGPLTAGPLILFARAAQRVSLATVGLMQYLSPTLQFLVGALFFGESFTMWHAASFALIWGALVVYSAEGLRHDKAARNRVSSVATSGTTAA